MVDGYEGSRFGSPADAAAPGGRIADRELLKRLPNLTENSALHSRLREIEAEAEPIRNDPLLSEDQKKSALSRLEARAKSIASGAATAVQHKKAQVVGRFQSHEIDDKTMWEEIGKLRMEDQKHTTSTVIKPTEGTQGGLDLSDPPPTAQGGSAPLMDSICDASEILVKTMMEETKGDVVAVLRALRKQAGAAMYDASQTNDSKKVEEHLVAVAINAMAYACLHEQV